MEAQTILNQSLAIIRQELAQRGYTFTGPWAAIVERVVHSTADFEFADLLQASPGAVDAGLAALRRGCALVTDVRMVAVGIRVDRARSLRCTVHCFVADPRVKAAAARARATRSALGIRRAAEQGLLDGSIVVIGNAPTALRETLAQVQRGVRPALVVGVPVGFVDAAESKEALMAQEHVPWISVRGRKGGSPVATAIINALLESAVQSLIPG